MTFDEHMERLTLGYAYDLMWAFVEGTASVEDADALFRTLMLDEGWGLEDASEVFQQALRLCDVLPDEDPQP